MSTMQTVRCSPHCPGTVCHADDRVVHTWAANTEVTINCPTCGQPYVVYRHLAGDQSACRNCRTRARRRNR